MATPFLPPGVASASSVGPGRTLRLTKLGWVVAGGLAALAAGLAWNVYRGRGASVGAAAGTVASAASTAAGDIVGAAGGIAGGVVGAAGGIAGGVAGAAGGIADGVANAARGVAGGVASAIGAVTGAVTPATSADAPLVLAPRPRDTLLGASTAAAAAATEATGAILPPAASFSAPAPSGLFRSLADALAGGGAPAIRHAAADFKPLTLPGPRRALNMDPRGPPDVEPAPLPASSLPVSDFVPSKRLTMDPPVAALA